MQKNEPRAAAALLFRICGFCIGTAGLIMQLCAEDVVGGGFMMRHDLAYFTIQTNLFSVLIFGILVVRTLYALKKTGHLTIASLCPGIHLACTLYITVTMLGFWLLLAPMTGFPRNPFLVFSTLTLHTLTPLAAVFDHILFAPHGGHKKSEAFLFLSYPFMYLLSVMLLSRILKTPYYSFQMQGSTVELFYPYPFLDPQLLGPAGVLAAVCALAVFFLLLGFLFLRADERLARHSEKTAGR